MVERARREHLQPPWPRGRQKPPQRHSQCLLQPLRSKLLQPAIILSPTTLFDKFSVDAEMTVYIPSAHQHDEQEVFIVLPLLVFRWCRRGVGKQYGDIPTELMAFMPPCCQRPVGPV